MEFVFTLRNRFGQNFETVYYGFDGVQVMCGYMIYIILTISTGTSSMTQMASSFTYVHKYIGTCIIITMVTIKVSSVATARGSDPTMLQMLNLKKHYLNMCGSLGKLYLVKCQ